MSSFLNRPLRFTLGYFAVWNINYVDASRKAACCRQNPGSSRIWRRKAALGHVGSRLTSARCPRVSMHFIINTALLRLPVPAQRGAPGRGALLTDPSRGLGSWTPKRVRCLPWWRSLSFGGKKQRGSPSRYASGNSSRSPIVRGYCAPSSAPAAGASVTVADKAIPCTSVAAFFCRQQLALGGRDVGDRSHAVPISG
jgi:hypothetical protein